MRPLRPPLAARLPSAAPLAALAVLAACPVPPRVHPRAAEEVSRGYRYLTGGDAERAEVAFRHALAFDPDFPEGENGLGLVARGRGDAEAARRSFERAVSLRPDFAEAHANLGELLLAGGDGPAAEDRLRTALQIDPDLADARQNLARALLWRGLEPGQARAGRARCFAQARREYLHLLEADPGRAAAHHDLGFMDYVEGSFARAEASYRRATELDPSSVEAHHGLCISLVRLSRCGEAVAACERCMELLAGGAGRSSAPPGPPLAAGQPPAAAPSLAYLMIACRQSLAGARACQGDGVTDPSPSRSLPGPGSP